MSRVGNEGVASLGKLKNIRETLSQRDSLKKAPLSFTRLCEREDTLGRPRLITGKMLKDNKLIEINTLLKQVMTLIHTQSVLDTLESIDEVIVKHTFNPLFVINGNEIKLYWRNEAETETVALIMFLRNSII